MDCLMRLPQRADAGVSITQPIAAARLMVQTSQFAHQPHGYGGEAGDGKIGPTAGTTLALVAGVADDLGRWPTKRPGAWPGVVACSASFGSRGRRRVARR